jgi:hypothetical protein
MHCFFHKLYNCLLHSIAALGYRLVNPGSRVRFSTGAGNFSLHHCVQNGSGTHPASYPMGTGGQAAGREADHSPPSIAEVKE